LKTTTSRAPLFLALLGALASAAVIGLAAEPAQGFSDILQWGEDAHGKEAGGGFLFGTGSQSDWGVTCAMCHTNNKGQQGNVTMTFTPTPAFQSVQGQSAYKPGQLYQIAVVMKAASGELLGTGDAEDLNNFAATIEDASGKLAGTLYSDVCPGGGQNNCVNTGACPDTYTPLPQLPANTTTYMYGQGCNTLFSLGRTGLTSWKFSWKAPAAGAGTVTLYYGAVDGDAAGEPVSSLGDDVAVGTVKLAEGS
jgi:hypothetical protein